MASVVSLMCRILKIKMTPQREVIAGVISDAKDHPDVEEIYKRANVIDRRISLATVYRTINIFEINGLVKKLEIGDGKARYESISTDAKDHHHHLIDIDSGEILEFTNHNLELLKEEIAAKLGYQLVDHRLELYGVKISK